MKFHFYLKDKRKSETLIYLKSWYHPAEKLPFVFSTSEHIKPEAWDSTNKRAREGRKHPTGITTNAIINKYKEAADRFIKEARASSDPYTPSHDELRRHLERLRDKMTGAEQLDSSLPKLSFHQFVEEYHNRVSMDPKRSEHYAKGFGILIRNFKLFEKDTKRRLDWSTLNFNTFSHWQRWCLTSVVRNKEGKVIKDEMAISTVANYWKRFKRILNDANEKGYYKGEEHTFKDLAIAEQEAAEVYLTMAEMMAIYRLELTRTLEVHRDIALLNGFAAGWRFQDLTRSELANVIPIKDFHALQFWASKTDTEVLVPTSWYWHEFREKYKGMHPRINNAQKFNQNLKIICRMAGITHDVTLRKNKGGKNILVTKPKCDFVHQYTFRYTFATLLHEMGLAVEHIQMLMGHTRIEQTLSYIKSKKRRAAMKAAQNPFFTTKPKSA